jgi:hypothetical protein
MPKWSVLTKAASLSAASETKRDSPQVAAFVPLGAGPTVPEPFVASARPGAHSVSRSSRCDRGDRRQRQLDILSCRWRPRGESAGSVPTDGAESARLGDVGRAMVDAAPAVTVGSCKRRGPQDAPLAAEFPRFPGA